MTECMPISTPPFDYQLDRPGTSGVAVAPELTIFPLADADGAANESKSEAAAAEQLTGRIMVRGPPVMGGYENNAHANAESFADGGWFDTGDTGAMDADGFLYITGRAKEVINRGGEIISPFEVEEALASHPDTREVMAFSAPHDVLQECVGVALVLEPGADPRACGVRALQRAAGGALHPSKWPQLVVLMDALPRSATGGGKLLRARFAQRCHLRAVSDEWPAEERLFAAHAPPAGAPLSTAIATREVRFEAADDDGAGDAAAEQAGGGETTSAQVVQIIKGITGGVAQPGDHLVGLGIDSLNLLELSRKLQAAFGVDDLNLMLIANPTVGELCDFIERHAEITSQFGKQTMNMEAVFGLRSFLMYWIIRNHIGSANYDWPTEVHWGDMNVSSRRSLPSLASPGAQAQHAYA